MVHQAQEQLVQELVASGDLPAPPSRYVLREKDRPTGGGPAPEDLQFPTLDLGRLADPGDADEAARLRAALRTWGLFAVTGHGVPAALLDEIQTAGRAFFHLPTEEKLRYANRTDAGEFQNEGYGTDRVDADEQVLDWCDRLYLQVQPAAARQPRLWPPSLAPLLHEYALRSEAVARQVLRAMARALGFGEDGDGDGGDSFFFGSGEENKVAAAARFTYYPPCPRPELVHGLKPHTDNSLVTTLLLDPDVGGLQVQLLRGDDAAGGGGEGRWVDVPALGHDLLVVVGDEMEIMSNAAFRAPTHRVVANGGRERMTLVTFYQPEPQRDLQPAEELVGEDRPALYKKVNVKDFGDGFWDAFARGEPTIDYVNARLVVADNNKQEAAA